MIHGPDAGLAVLGGVLDVIGQELAYQRLNLTVEGGREQHALSVCRSVGEDGTYLGQEAHVGHLIGLVERGDLDGVQDAGALTEVIGEATRGGDEDVDSAAELLDLLVERGAADGGHDSQTLGIGIGSEGFDDLERELAGGDQHERTRALGSRAVGVQRQALQDRQAEGKGLARAGLRTTEDVLTGDRVGKCLLLNGGGHGDRVARQCGDDCLGQSEIGEGEGRCRCGRRDCRGVGSGGNGCVGNSVGHAVKPLRITGTPISPKLRAPEQPGNTKNSQNTLIRARALSPGHQNADENCIKWGCLCHFDC